MKDIDPEKDYQASIEPVPFDVLLRLEKDIDRSRFPDRHRLVTDLIEKHRKNNTIQYSQAYLDNQRYPDGVRFIRSVNAFMLCGAIVVLLLKAVDGSVRLNLETVLSLTLGLAFSSLVVYGLFREKSWVVIMVLLSSYLGLFGEFIGFFADNGAPMDRLIHSAGRIAFASFYVFQIVVFSRQSTRAFFKEKGTVLLRY